MSFIAAAAIAAGGAVVGGYLSSRGAGKAADTQAAAADRAAQLQYQMWQEQQALQAPWRKAGEGALNQLIPLASNYQPFTAAGMYNDPGYQFRLSEGLKAVDRQAAARGGLISGAALKAAQRYGQDYASGEYQNAFNRYQAERQARLGPLQSLAGLGQTSVNALGQMGQNYANQAGEAYMGAGNARASGYVGQANALNQALGGVGNAAMNYAYLNRFAPQVSYAAPAMYPGAGTTLPSMSPEGW